MEDVALALEADQELGGWRLLGPLEEHEMSDERQAILDVLRESCTPMTPAMIAQGVESSADTVKHLVLKMSKAGVIESNGRGKYSLRFL